MWKIKINGIIQGVGFRPFIYRLAHQFKLNGYVHNTTSGVEIVISGDKKKFNHFIEKVRKNHPSGADIKDLQIDKIKTKNYNNFTIKESKRKKGFTLVSPDLAVCEDCAEELHNSKDSRYGYALINCTNCGPRYSIIQNLPYDRPMTSMKQFSMCSFCENEYNDPLNRRFHAQPVACPKCGPELRLLNSKFVSVKGDPIKKTIELLKKGKIIGIKGIGGFHIACNAQNDKAVLLLRKRKKRPRKPFAVMCYAEKLMEIVSVTSSQMKLLKSSQAPVLVLPKKEPDILSSVVAPYNPFLGVFLPYTPIHHLILSKYLPFLIMTSGNCQDEPIAKAEKDLEGLCDYYLTHNRAIINQNDDSIILPADKVNILARRSRGYVPLPIDLPVNTVPSLGVGAQLKLSFSLAKQKSLFLSPYLGNADNKKTMDFFSQTVDAYKRWFKIKPELVAADVHPDYFTTHFAKELRLPLVQIQHHFAHIVSVMAEYKLKEPVIGIAYDGTGYGPDGTIWGSEIMVADYTQYKRGFCLNDMPLPGGDASILHPLRIALAYLIQAGEDISVIKNISSMEKSIIEKQVENKFNIISTSSMGRLFDCVSALLGLIHEVTFEAEAAMRLEFSALKASSTRKRYPYSIEDNRIDIIPLLRALVKDIKNKTDINIIAQTFHNTIVFFTLDAVNKLNRLTNIKKVVLSGGVMQNRIIVNGLIRELERRGYEVFFPIQIPVNDGCISVGQVVAANVYSHSR